MASVATHSVTAEEFFEFVHRPENRHRWFELDEGEIEEMPPPGERHGVVCANVVGLLWTFTRQTRKGYVTANDAGILLERDPDTVRGPDAALYLGTREFGNLSEGYSEALPDLVVDVLSPQDRPGRMMRRIGQFQKRGIGLIWLVDPEARTITVFRPDQLPEVLNEDQDLAGGDLPPGFRTRVGDFFAT